MDKDFCDNCGEQFDEIELLWVEGPDGPETWLLCEECRAGEDEDFDLSDFDLGPADPHGRWVDFLA